jgi:hypothetical protein
VSGKPLFGVTEIEGGFPHSEIFGSKPVRGSPKLIAAYHVLHRLSAPRHPPDTLKTLDCSHCQRAPFGSAPDHLAMSQSFANSTRQSTDPPLCARIRWRWTFRKDQFCFKRIREPAVKLGLTTEMLDKAATARPDLIFRSNPLPAPALDRMRFLFTMSDNPRHTRQRRAAKLLFQRTKSASLGHRRLTINRLVEPDGIEPTTSCLQSTRSPN